MRYCDLNDIHSQVGRVMNRYCHFNVLCCVLRNRAIYKCWVCSVAPWPITWWKTGTFCKVCDNAGIYRIDCFKSIVNALGVVIGGVLFSSTGYAIMMLYYSNNIEHSLFCLKHGFDLLIGYALGNWGKCKQLVWAVQSLRGSSHVALVIGARGEISSPKRIFIICIREHVIVLGWPLNILGRNCINVHRGSRVDELNVTVDALVCIVVLDHFVGWLKILVGVLVAEIVSHCY